MSPWSWRQHLVERADGSEHKCWSSGLSAQVGEGWGFKSFIRQLRHCRQIWSKFEIALLLCQFLKSAWLIWKKGLTFPACHNKGCWEWVEESKTERDSERECRLQIFRGRGKQCKKEGPGGAADASLMVTPSQLELVSSQVALYCSCGGRHHATSGIDWQCSRYCCCWCLQGYSRNAGRGSAKWVWYQVPVQSAEDHLSDGATA